jgi:hypothetical protein
MSSRVRSRAAYRRRSSPSCADAAGAIITSSAPRRSANARSRRGRRRILDRGQRQHRPAAPHERHPLQLWSGQLFGVGRRRCDDRVRGDQDLWTCEHVRGRKSAAVEIERALGAAAGEEMRREHVRQAEVGREHGRVVGRSEQPDRRRAARGGGRSQLVRLVVGQPHRGTTRRQETLDGAHVARKVVDAGISRATQDGRHHRVAAGRPTDAQVDPTGRKCFEQRELLRDDQGRMVGQHHAAGADTDAPRVCGQHRHQDGRVRRPDRRHVVMLGHPVAVVSEIVGPAHER